MTYAIRYKIEPGSFASNDVGPNEGLTDAMLFASIVREEGGTSTAWVSRDGDGPMSNDMQFIQWGILAAELMKLGLSPDQYRICSEAFEAIQALVKEDK